MDVERSLAAVSARPHRSRAPGTRMSFGLRKDSRDRDRRGERARRSIGAQAAQSAYPAAVGRAYGGGHIGRGRTRRLAADRVTLACRRRGWLRRAAAMHRNHGPPDSRRSVRDSEAGSSLHSQPPRQQQRTARRPHRDTLTLPFMGAHTGAQLRAYGPGQGVATGGRDALFHLDRDVPAHASFVVSYQLRFWPGGCIGQGTSETISELPQLTVSTLGRSGSKNGRAKMGERGTAVSELARGCPKSDVLNSAVTSAADSRSARQPGKLLEQARTWPEPLPGTTRVIPPRSGRHAPGPHGRSARAAGPRHARFRSGAAGDWQEG